MLIDPEHQDRYYDSQLGVLRNHLGITDPWKLSAVEQLVVEGKMTRNTVRPARGFAPDLADLRSLHQDLFGDIYPWAGQLRAAEVITRDEPRTQAYFSPPPLIPLRTSIVLDQLAREYDSLMVEADPRAWADRMPYYLGELVRTKPFFDGNQRTAAALISDVAHDCGHHLEWRRVPDVHFDLAKAALLGSPDDPDYEPFRQVTATALGLDSQQRDPQRLRLLDHVDGQLSIEAASAEILHYPYVDHGLFRAIRDDWPNIAGAAREAIIHEIASRPGTHGHRLDTVDTRLRGLDLHPTADAGYRLQLNPALPHRPTTPPPLPPVPGAGPQQPGPRR